MGSVVQEAELFLNSVQTVNYAAIRNTQAYLTLSFAGMLLCDRDKNFSYPFITVAARGCDSW